MRKTILGFTTALMVMTLATFAFAETATKAPEAKTSKASNPVVIDEEVWVVLVDEPAHHFSRAYEDFLKKDWKSSADEIRTANAYLKLEKTRATDEGKQALSASIQELDKLADNVESGSVSSIKSLDEAFARAHLALAKHHYLKAADAWKNKQTKIAGEALRASAYHLEQAMIWEGYDEEDLVVKVKSDTKVIADKLVAGSGWVRDEVDQLLNDTGQAIEKLGKAMQSSKQ
jgi:hypothetical protein